MTQLVMTLTLLAAGPRFIEDDYARALAQAKQQKKLLFVDAWAPWCHTCIYLREHVLSRQAFTAYEKDLVFAAVDTEKPSAAPFLEKFPIEVWPTLLFIDPATERVVFKWLGSADEAQLRALLDAAKGGPGAVAEADALFAQGQAGAAAQRYAESTKSARSVLSMLSALYLAKSYQACAKASVDQLALFTAPGDRVNAVTWGLGCALELPESTERKKLVDTLVAEGRALLADGTKVAAVLADDVSGLYEALVTERQAAKLGVEAEQLAAVWLGFLERQAAAARSPAARAVFDPHGSTPRSPQRRPRRCSRHWCSQRKTCRGTTTHPRDWRWSTANWAGSTKRWPRVGARSRSAPPGPVSCGSSKTRRRFSRSEVTWQGRRRR
jgi:thiol-disulfide isomerase/thioredoxin